MKVIKGARIMKTKYEPIYVFNGVASCNMYMLYARYDFKSGLYEFKTQKILKDCYTTNFPKINYDTQAILDKLREKEQQ